MTVPDNAPRIAPAVAKAFRIVDVLATRRPGGAKLSDLARELSLPKSSTLRILNTLCELGVARADAETKSYYLGPRLLSYASTAAHDESDLVRQFYRTAGPMHARLDETIQLAVLSSPDVTFVARLDSSKAVRLVTHVGKRLPAHATAVGKAILAFSDQAEVEQVLLGGLPQFTENTITDQAEFLRILDQARRDGYATEVEESSANLSCFSAPVLGPDGMARAGLTICVPTRNVDAARSAELIREVQAGARELSGTL